MKNLILLLAFVVAAFMASPTKAVAATNTAAVSSCLFCSKSPAKRYAKAHKDKMFKGFKMSKQNKKNARSAKRKARK